MTDKTTIPTPPTTEAKRPASGRSPGYPSIDLKVALEKATKIYAINRRTLAHYSAVVGALGYGSKSGQGRLVFAALKSFGLIEIKGEGATKTACISEVAVRILIDNRPGSVERRALLQQLALRPRMYRVIWNQYQGALPTDPDLIYALRTTHKFTEAGAKEFVGGFRSTLAFAEVDASTTIERSLAGAEADDAEESEDTMETATIDPPGRTLEGTKGTGGPPPKLTPKQGPRLTFTLAGDNVLEVSLRSRVSRREFEKIKTLVDLAEDSFVEPDAPPSAQ